MSIKEVNSLFINNLRQNIGLETWKWHQIVTSQTAQTKYKRPPYDPQPNPPWKLSAYATGQQHGYIATKAMDIVYLLIITQLFLDRYITAA